MVGLNGGLDVDEGFYNFSIIDDEPILIFSAGQGYDIVSTYSQLKTDYKIITFKSGWGSGYLYPKNMRLDEIKGDFNNGVNLIEKEINHYDVFNYDRIVSFGDFGDYKGENYKKAYNWFMNEVFKNTPSEKTSWIKRNTADITVSD